MPNKKMKRKQLIEPYGGELVNLIVDDATKQRLMEKTSDMDSIALSNRALCDLEMLAIGAFSPLKGFMNQKDYKSVLSDMRLSDGTLFPMPITLPVDKKYRKGAKLALRDPYGSVCAVIKVEDCYEWNPDEYAEAVLGVNDEAHPLVHEMKSWGKYNISGPLEVIKLPVYHDFKDYRMTPAETREKLLQLGNEHVVAFQTRNPLHRAHEELTKRAADKINGTLLLHPVVGMTKPGDVDHITRVRCYKALLDNHYDDYKSMLSLMPLAMRMAGPREALWHAIIRRNYGANHFIIGRDHAGPGKNSNGEPFFGPYAAQDLVRKYEDEIGVSILTFNAVSYVPKEDKYYESHEIADNTEIWSISGTQVREEYLEKGKKLPDWFTRPEVASVLADAYPHKQKQGFCLWFTGLSGAGKSTLAQAIEALILERGRRVTMFDGDVVRQNLSKGLGFSKEDRDTNVKRVGFVASKVAYHGGVSICALISPYKETRQAVRELFDDGNFIEIYISTPFDVCKERDPKGHYAKAKKGKIKQFTGMDSSYEPPVDPEIAIDTSNMSVEECVDKVITELVKQGLIE